MVLSPNSKKNPKPQNTQIQDDLNLVYSFFCTDVARKPRPTSLTECDSCLFPPNLHQAFPGKIPNKL